MDKKFTLDEIRGMLECSCTMDENGGTYCESCQMFESEDGTVRAIIRQLLARVESARKALVEAREWEDLPCDDKNAVWQMYDSCVRRHASEIYEILKLIA